MLTSCLHICFSFQTVLYKFLIWFLSHRGNNLRKDDAENLGYAFAYMPNLEDLDISDNPIEDEGLRSILFLFCWYFSKI